MACLEACPTTSSRSREAECVRDAWEHPALFESDLVILDPSLPGGTDFVGAVREATGARVIVCASDCARGRGARRAPGRRGRLPAQGQADARVARRPPSRAAANGTGVVTPDLLEHLLDGVTPEASDAARRRAR